MIDAPELRPEGVYRCYKPKNFQSESLRTIGRVNGLLLEYDGVVSLRQIYYQFVARNWLENSEASYDRLGSIISDGRMAGLISWTAFEDRNRGLVGLDHQQGPAQAMRRTRNDYRIDLWRNQPWRPEVWVEKAALEGVVGEICNKLRVNFMALRGYNSSSEAWNAAQRFRRYADRGQRAIVFHLGDHDPSGLDMTRDNRERLELMTGAPVIVQRLALNMPQIEQYNPPPNPAKQSDARFKAYAREYGTTSSWELDALEPKVIHDLIEDAVTRIRDPQLWDEMVAQEASDIDFLDDTIDLAFPGSKEPSDEN